MEQVPTSDKWKIKLISLKCKSNSKVFGLNLNKIHLTFFIIFKTRCNLVFFFFLEC